MICIYAVYVDWSSLKESVLVVTLSTVSRCAWHLARTAEAAAGKLNMLPTNWASERLSSLDTFLFIFVFSRIKMRLSLKKKKKRITSESILRPDLLTLVQHYSAPNSTPAMNKYSNLARSIAVSEREADCLVAEGWICSSTQPVGPGLCTYLLIFPDLKQTLNDRWVIKLFAFLYADMNENKAQHWNGWILLCAIYMASVWQNGSDEMHSEG